MSGVDLKLLAIVLDLHRTRSVSQTAENLGLNQPTVSMSLARLRRVFNDPLFVNTHKGMEATRHADRIIPRLRDAEALIRSAIEYQETFDPATSGRIFRISSTDIGQVVVLPALMNRLRTVAPNAVVDFTTFSEQSQRQMESGDMDLALGFIPPLRAGYHRQKLFTEHFVCVVRARHPRIRGTLTLEAFEREFHLVVTTAGTGHGLLERTLDAANVRRKVGLRVPSFLGLATLVASTDLLVTVPERFALVMAMLTRVQIFPPPVPIPQYFVMQYWHERSDKDPGNRWLRALMKDVFREQPSIVDRQLT